MAAAMNMVAAWQCRVAPRQHAKARPAVCACGQVDSIQSSEAIVAVVDAIDRPKEALAMFQPGA